MYAADAFCFCRTRLFLNNASPEKQADAPDCSKSYKAVDYSCDNAVLPAANPGYKVKFKKTNKTQLSPPIMLRINAILFIIVIFSSPNNKVLVSFPY